MSFFLRLVLKGPLPRKCEEWLPSVTCGPRSSRDPTVSGELFCFYPKFKRTMLLKIMNYIPFFSAGFDEKAPDLGRTREPLTCGTPCRAHAVVEGQKASSGLVTRRSSRV